MGNRRGKSASSMEKITQENPERADGLSKEVQAGKTRKAWLRTINLQSLWQSGLGVTVDEGQEDC